MVGGNSFQRCADKSNRDHCVLSGALESVDVSSGEMCIGYVDRRLRGGSSHCATLT